MVMASRSRASSLGIGRVVKALGGARRSWRRSLKKPAIGDWKRLVGEMGDCGPTHPTPAGKVSLLRTPDRDGAAMDGAPGDGAPGIELVWGSG